MRARRGYVARVDCPAREVIAAFLAAVLKRRTPWLLCKTSEANHVEERAQVENAAESQTKARIVEIIREYNADMQKAGRPYRYG